MMRRFATAVGASIFIACETTAPPASDGTTEAFLARHHLTESVAHHAELVKAAELVNALLSPDMELQLSDEVGHPGAVPIIVARGGGLTDKEVMFVPEEGERIVVSADAVNRFVRSLSGTGDAGMDVDMSEVLALLLLHEAGHIRDERDHRRPSGSGLTEQDLLAPWETTTHAELRADKFAAGRIGAAMTSKSVDAFSAGVALSMLVPKLCWNLTSTRLLEHFGGTTLGDTTLFREAATYAHPNLELRFLTLDFALSKSDTARAAVLQFWQHRQRPQQQ
ncbi:MAG: hypothetical protein U0414_31855 [Polyangiaceae bacterium]